MLRNNRVIYSDNGVLNDLSINLSNPLSGTEVIPFVAAQDALYLGSDFPFNHRYIDVKTVNAIASVVSVELWSGSAWVSAVDVVDETAVSGVSLAQSGIISWSPDRRQGSWGRQFSTEDIPALSTLKIYDLYWARIKFSADLTNTTELQSIGHKFSNDSDLFAEYSLFNNVALLNAFEASKADWDDQAFLAANYIIQDLRAGGVIMSRNQILDWNVFRNASIHKTASIIFQGMGKDYLDNLNTANRNYAANMNLKSFSVDLNPDAILDDEEGLPNSEYMTR